jgi:hypothetical protein
MAMHSPSKTRLITTSVDEMPLDFIEFPHGRNMPDQERHCKTVLGIIAVF